MGDRASSLIPNSPWRGIQAAILNAKEYSVAFLYLLFYYMKVCKNRGLVEKHFAINSNGQDFHHAL